MDKIELQLPDGSIYQIDNRPGLTYIIGPNGVGKSYAFKKFARENISDALYILPTRDDVRRNLRPVVYREEDSFFREWLAYEQICQYWNRAVRQPGLLAMAFSFLERLGVPQRLSVSVEDGGIKFHMAEGDSCSLVSPEAPGFVNLPVLGIAVYDPERKLVIIDEPEQSLHPQAQHIFVQVMREVARLQGKHFILITHSPSMIDLRTAEDLSRMVFFRRPKNYLAERKVFQISAHEAGYYADLLPSLTTYKREIFFADKVVLVEGQHDRDVLHALIEAGGYGVSLARTSVLPLGGIGYMAKYAAFFKEIGVKPFVICDRDAVYPSAAMRWHCGYMEGDRLEWRGWVGPARVQVYVKNKQEEPEPGEKYLNPAEFERLEGLASKLRQAMKRALDLVIEQRQAAGEIGSCVNLLQEIEKKFLQPQEYREYRAFHLLMTVVLQYDDWQNTVLASTFEHLRQAFELMAAQAADLDILILRCGRLEDLYRHSGKKELAKTEKALREAADIRQFYQGQPEKVDEDYAEVLVPLTRKRFLIRMNRGIPHEAAAVLSGKITEIYDYLFGAGELADRIEKLQNSGKLEELSWGAAVVAYDLHASPPEVVLQIPLLKGYISPDGRLKLRAGQRPDVFKMLYAG